MRGVGFWLRGFERGLVPYNVAIPKRGCPYWPRWIRCGCAVGVPKAVYPCKRLDTQSSTTKVPLGSPMRSEPAFEMLSVANLSRRESRVCLHMTSVNCLRHSRSARGGPIGPHRAPWGPMGPGAGPGARGPAHLVGGTQILGPTPKFWDRPLKKVMKKKVEI